MQIRGRELRQLKLVVARMDTFTIWEAAQTDNSKSDEDDSNSDPSEAELVTVQDLDPNERDMELKLTVTYEPSDIDHEDIGERVLWRILTLEDDDPENWDDDGFGNFGEEDKSDTWTDPEGGENRQFYVYAGYDCDGFFREVHTGYHPTSTSLAWCRFMILSEKNSMSLKA